jgi:O-antigen/teichoic acid export membrane protein
MLLGYSKVSFGITIGWLIMFNTDTFLLGLMSSSAAAGVYNPATSLMLYLRNIVNSIGTPLTPAISHVEASGDIEKIRSVYLRGVRYVTYLSVLLTVGVVIYAGWFVGLWLPEEFSQTAEVMIVLAFGSAVFLPQIIGNSVLFGTGRHKYILKTLAWESVSKIILSLLLIPRYGIIGMALANAIPQMVLYLTLYPVYMARALGLSYWQILVIESKAALLAIVVSAPVALAMRSFVPPDRWATLAANALVVALVALAAGYFILEAEDRRKLASFFRSKT